MRLRGGLGMIGPKVQRCIGRMVMRLESGEGRTREWEKRICIRSKVDGS
jgi:hypothetical protein